MKTLFSVLFYFFSLQLVYNQCTCMEDLPVVGGRPYGNLLLCDNLETYTNGNISPQNPLRWKKWDPSAPDAVVATYTGGVGKYLRLEHAATQPDVLLLLGNKTSGRYRLSWNMNVLAGRTGYYNIQHNQNGSAGPNTAFNVIFNANGTGSLIHGGQSTAFATFNYTNGGWNRVTHIIDLDSDNIEFWLNGNFIASWQFSLGTQPLNRLGSVNFFANTNSLYAIDDICFYEAQLNLPCTQQIDPVCVNFPGGGGYTYTNPCWASRALYTPDEYESCTPSNGDCDLEGLNTGNISTQSASDPWVLWPQGGDGVVTTERAFNGSKSLKITSSNPQTDLVYKLGNLTTADGNWDGNDVYRYSWKMYVPTANGAYYNMQHSESLNHWAYHVYFNPNGNGELKYGTSTAIRAIFQYPKNQWFSVTQIIRLGGDEAELWINGQFVHKWTFSIGVGPNNSTLNLNQIGAFNFYGNANLNSLFFIDEVLCNTSETCFGIFDCSSYPDVVCVNGREFNSSGIPGGGGCNARCEGYTEEEWTAGPCTSGPCFDCWDCFYYLADITDPLVCKFYNTYCEVPRDEPTGGVENLAGYDYEWTVTGGTVTYQNGTSSTSLNPIMKFPGAGSYTICMRVYFAFPGGSRSLVYECCLVVIVNQGSNCSGPPVAHFTYTFNSSDNSFTLNSSTSTGVSNRKWDFGDNYGNGGAVTFLQGTTNTSISPRIVIPAGYCREICLSVGSGCGLSTYCVTLCRNSSECTGNTPVYTLNNAISPSINSNTVSFSGIPAPPGGTTVEYSWDFGDGVGKSTARNPSYTYPTHGYYTICVVIRIGCKIICYCWSVHINPCPTPVKSICGSISHRYGGSGLQYVFTSTQTIAPGQQWRVNDSPVSGATGNSFTYPFPTPGQYEVCFPYLNANGCLAFCCYLVEIFNPFDCYDWGYYYVGGANPGFQFRLNSDIVGATDITWTDDSNNFAPIGSGSSSQILPIPGTGCVEKIITAKYFWNGRWYICCRRVWLCNPFDCVPFRPIWVNASGGYRFEFTGNTPSPQLITWQEEDSNGQLLSNLGTNRNSNILPVPPGGCVDRIISIKYFDGTRWWICCLRFRLCNPFDCFPVRYIYADNQGYQFTLNQTGAQIESWRVEDAQTGALIQDISNGTQNTSHYYPVPPGGCVERIISVRYRLNGILYICCRRVWICNPNLCGNEINYSVTGNGNVTLNTNSTYQDVQWYDGNTLIGNGTQINRTYPTGSTVTICIYYRLASGIYYMCCRTFVVQPCNLPTPLFTHNINGTAVTFTNSTQNGTSYSWDFGNGQTSTLQNPGAITFVPGDYRVCLTATNSCGSNTYCVNITIGGGTSTPPWTDPTPTLFKHSIAFFSNLASDINGTPIQIGDWIGVFYEDTRMFKPAGFKKWEGQNLLIDVVGDDPATPAKEGLSDGETFKFKVWRASDNTENDVQALYLPIGTPVGPFLTDATDKFIRRSGLDVALSAVSRLETSSRVTIDIPLTTGWNLISSNVLPDNLNLETIFSPIVSQIESVRDLRNSYIPGFFNGIGNWDIRSGYYVKSKSNITLQITGEKVNPATSSIPINPNWQMIAYYCDSNVPVGNAFSALTNDIESVRNLTQSYIPGFSTPDAICMKPFQGYLVKGKPNISRSLTYTCQGSCQSPNPGNSNITERSKREFQISDNSAVLVLPASVLNDNIKTGDEIRVYSSDDILCGSVTWRGENTLLTFWGDDNTTLEKEGLKEQERFRITVVNAITGEEKEAPFVLDHKVWSYAPNEFYWVVQVKHEVSIPVFTLFPNPANQIIHIQLSGEWDRSTRVIIRDVHGRTFIDSRVNEIADNTGRISVELSGFSPGMYFVNCVDALHSETQKFILSK